MVIVLYWSGDIYGLICVPQRLKEAHSLNMEMRKELMMSSN